MRSSKELKELLEPLEMTQDQTLVMEGKLIEKAYHKDSEQQSFGIKLLSVFGGLLASTMLVAFLMLWVKHSTTGQLITGAMSIVIAVLMSKKLDKIIYDTLAASLLIIGFSFIYIGLGSFISVDNYIYLALMLLALACLCFTQNYMLAFISVMVFNMGFLLVLITDNLESYILIYVDTLVLGFSYLILHEAKIIKRSALLSKLYNPLKTGFIFSLVIGMGVLSVMSYVDAVYLWMSSLLNIAVILYFLSRIFKHWEVTAKKDKWQLYLLTLLVLLPTMVTPTISGAILILLLSFTVHYKTGFVIGVLACIYFLSKFYYDLEYSLLIKSVLLLTSGGFFLLLYLFTFKKLSSHEEI